MPTQTGSLDLKGLKQTYNKTIAVVQPIYCRTNSSTAPAASTRPTTVKITKTDDTGTTAPSSNGNGWTTMLMARICSSNFSYKYLWTCQQLLAADGTVLGCTSIVEDKGTTIIDGDTITTGTVNTERLNVAGVITAINDDSTTTINGGKITTGTLSADSINTRSGTFDTALIPQLTISKIDTLQTALNGKANSGAENTALSYLSYDSTTGLDIGFQSSAAKTNINGSGVSIYDGSGLKRTVVDTGGMKVLNDNGDAVASFGEETVIGTTDEYNVHFFNDYTETDDGAGGILDKEYNGGLKVFYADGIQGRVAHKKEDIYNGSSSPEIQVTSLILQNISPNRTKGTEITMLPNQVKICAGAYNSSTERVADTRATYVDASGIDTRCVKCGGYPILTIDTVPATISVDATDHTINTTKAGYTAIGIVGWDWSGTGTATCYMNRLSLNSSGNIVVNAYRAAGTVSATLEVNVLYIATAQGI